MFSLNRGACRINRLVLLLLGLSAFITFILFTNQGKLIYTTEDLPNEIYVVEKPKALKLVSVDLTADTLYEKARNKSNLFPVTVHEKLWNKDKNNCTQYPSIYDLNYLNTYWQRFKPHDTMDWVTIDLFGAYYDDRPKVGQPVIRMTSVINLAKPNFKIFCQMWFNDDPVGKVSPVTAYNMIWNQGYRRVSDGTYIAYLITCPVPQGIKEAPVAVSLVNTECEHATNNLRVQNERPINGTKKDFAVCVKGLDFPFDDDSVSLIQFFEANFMFGVDKIVLYDLQVHPNISRVLDYYIKQNKIELHPVSLPGSMPNEPYLRHMFLKNRHLIKILNEVVPYNDCFYKNIHLYKYILLLDIDEVFVPNKGDNYKEMLKNVNGANKNNFSTYYSRNKIFVKNEKDKNNVYTDLPEYLEMLQITTVATNYEKPYKVNVKSFFNTEDLLTLNNHMPYACIGKCNKKEIPDNVGQLNHYRKKCFYDNRNNCPKNNYDVINNTLFWKFKDEFISRTIIPIKSLKLV